MRQGMLKIGGMDLTDSSIWNWFLWIGGGGLLLLLLAFIFDQFRVKPLMQLLTVMRAMVCSVSALLEIMVGFLEAFAPAKKSKPKKK